MRFPCSYPNAWEMHVAQLAMYQIRIHNTNNFHLLQKIFNANVKNAQRVIALRAARRRAYMINLEKTRPKQLAEGKVTCPLCAGKTKPVQYSLSLGDRTGIVPIVENDASFSYVAAMQRQCGSGQCGCIFFDYDALAQLPAGERSSLPFSAEMATGELFIGRALEQDIALAMTKYIFIKNLVICFLVCSFKDRYVWR